MLLWGKKQNDTKTVKLSGFTVDIPAGHAGRRKNQQDLNSLQAEWNNRVFSSNIRCVSDSEKPKLNYLAVQYICLQMILTHMLERNKIED